MLADARTGKNGRHTQVGLLRQSVLGRLADYEDVNDAERLRHDPALRWIIGGKAAQGRAASPRQMGFFETQWLAADTNLSVLTDRSGQWIDVVLSQRPLRGIMLDMDSSVSPTRGSQEYSVWNGHYQCTCYHPLFVFNQSGDLERCVLRPGNVHNADGREGTLMPVIVRYHGKVSGIYFHADAIIFFKWYGKNVDTFLDTSAFHEKWKYIQTIGVSVFSKKVSTSKHFEPIRPNLRMLYHLNDIDDRSAFIVVGNRISYWKNKKLFIFHDTLLH